MHKSKVIWGIIFGVLSIAVVMPASAQQMTVSEVVKALGYSAEDEKKAEAGEVVAVDLKETTDKMLAQSVAVVLPVKVGELTESVQSGAIFKSDTNLIARGSIDPAAPEAGLAKAVYTANESGELNNLGQAEPGSEFNLSSDEYATITAAGGKPEAVMKAYQGILANRVRAYATKGLKGVAPYDRGDGDTSSPADALTAMATAETVLKKANPKLYQAFLDYPQNNPEDAEEMFSWEKRNVQDRPTFVLVHRMIINRPDRIIVLMRQFYVGQSYNAAQAVSGAIEIKEGTLVLSDNRTSTDQVAGFMSGTRHSIGRGMMRDELVKRLKEIKAQLSK